jgi:hypothetical protein
MRKGLIVLVAVAVVVVAGAAAYILTSGDKPVVSLAASDNEIKIEAAGVRYGSWPEMDVLVNDTVIASLKIDSEQRAMYSVAVPNSVGDISTVQLKFTNYQECQNVGTGDCNQRKIIVRGIYLNDKKLEGAVASGGKNLASLLQSEEGGITWKAE